MAPQVKKARTAFLYYQSDHLSKVRAELGQGASMGDAMTEVGTYDEQGEEQIRKKPFSAHR